MHLEAYRQRPDIAAAVHAHPPTVVACTVAGVSFSSRALPEMIIGFGEVPVTAYATPGTKEGAGIVRDLIVDHDALVLDRHGSFTVGTSPLAAFFKLEHLEHAAAVLVQAHLLGGARDLSEDQLARLTALRRELMQGDSRY